VSAPRLAVDQGLTVVTHGNTLAVSGLKPGTGYVITRKADDAVNVRRIEPKVPSELLTFTEAADRLGISRSRVRQLCEEGRLRDFLDSHGHRVLHVDEVARFAALPRVSGRPKGRQNNHRA
jgi:excisionase family DNA binding protein